ncbi:MAG TPA: DUF4920 domain-containing protein [Adhaeribacter sp.]|nr:DUF4920 domain-containing protein [Adhaeribacter sp.]
MKKLLYTALAVTMLATTACNKTTETTETTTETASEDNLPEAKAGQTYGEAITADGAIEVAELKSKLNEQDSLVVKIKGEIDEVCQMKGCWVTLKLPNDESMRVKFGNDEFFVPKNVTGRTAVMQGVAYKDIIPVDEQRHYLEDAGKPQAEIDAITEPDTTLTFNARGIIFL